MTQRLVSVGDDFKLPADVLTALALQFTTIGYVAGQLAALPAVARSGAYSDLTGKPTIPTTPGQVGAQPAGDYATHTDLSTAITGVVGAAPAVLNTLAKVAAQLATDEGAENALQTLVGVLATVAHSGLFTDLTLPSGGIPATALASTVPTAAQVATTGARVLSGPTATLAANGTLTAGLPNALDATSTSITATLPTPTVVGQLLPVERVDTSTTTTVTVTGTVRGVATTITLPALGIAGEGLLFEAESLTSWRPIAGHKPTSWLDARYDPRGAAAGLALVFGA